MGCTHPSCNACAPAASSSSGGSRASGGSAASACTNVPPYLPSNCTIPSGFTCPAGETPSCANEDGDTWCRGTTPCTPECITTTRCSNQSSAGSEGSTGSTSSDTPPVCNPLSCGETLGGTRFCQEVIGLPVCTVIDDLPCIACSDYPSSGSSSSNGNGASSDGNGSASSASSSFNACLSICGNGGRECNEECDDGNTRNDDGCNGSCYVEGGFCGDGIIQSLRGENCEPNLTDPSTDCNGDTCRLITIAPQPPVCGNSRREGMEECDDGNLNGGFNSFCNTSCKRTSGYCGNGIVESGRGEDCEPSLVSSDAPLSCSSSCRYDYFVNASSAPALIPDSPQCAGNECSLGGSDFCGSMRCEAISELPCLQCVGGACFTDADCTDGAVCRDGVCILSFTPGADGGIARSSASSRSSLVSSSAASTPLFVAMAGCGNGELGAGEQCDEGRENSLLPNAFCRPDCTFSRCGDTVIDAPLETCDDGSRNGLLVSECSAFCRLDHSAPGVLPATLIELPFMPVSGSNQNGTTTGIGGSDSVFIPGSQMPPSTTASGPATVAIMAAGAAAGYAWMRRRR
ncbi:DUF4215 domain-containing protein [Candidatus Peribacteria bacterium]|nr:MAG: DUF4215 domain-containing protein [Candidatus Peribacteria bacterium]